MITLSNEDHLLCLLNSYELNEKKRLLGRKIAMNPSFNWEHFFHLTKLNQTIPLTLKNLEKLDLEKYPVPSELLEKSNRIRKHNETRHVTGLKMLKALSIAGIDVVVLKGFLFAEILYKDNGYKKMNDIDILVEPKNVAKTLEVLEASGFYSFGKFLGMSSKVSNETHHTPPYLSHDGECMVGVHWNISSPKRHVKPDIKNMWLRKTKITIGDVPAFSFCPEDNVFHVAIHLPPFKTGVRELADISNIILKAGASFDWGLLFSHTKKAKAYNAIYRALQYAAIIGDIKIPDHFLKKLLPKVSLATKTDLKIRFSKSEKILQSRSVVLGKIEKSFISFLKSKNRKERITIWTSMMKTWLNPGYEEALKIIPFSENQIVTRTLAPLALWKSMANEYGYKNLTAITAFHILETSKEFLYLKNSNDGPRFSKSPEAEALERLE